MTLPFNDVDADGAVSLAEFLGRAPAWIARHGPRRRRRHHDRRFRPEPRLRHDPVRPDAGAPTPRKGDHRMGLEGFGFNRRRFRDLSEQEVLALAISSEEDDARIYRSYAERLRADYPDSAAMFDEMAAEEDGHRQRLIELHRARFGEVIPLIRREHVAGYYARRPVWLVENLGLDRIRAEAAAMEQDAEPSTSRPPQRTDGCRHPQAPGRSCPGRGGPPRQCRPSRRGASGCRCPRDGGQTARIASSC
jgi:hypothetical protein